MARSTIGGGGKPSRPPGNPAPFRGDSFNPVPTKAKVKVKVPDAVGEHAYGGAHPGPAPKVKIKIPTARAPKPPNDRAGTRGLGTPPIKVHVTVHANHTAAPAAAPASSPSTAPAAAAPRNPGPRARVRTAAGSRPAAAAVTGAAPLTDEQQAQQILQETLGPIADALNQRTQAGTQAVKGYTADLARLAAAYGPQAAQAYGDAERSQSSIDSALNAQLGTVASSSADAAAKGASFDPTLAAGLAAAVKAQGQGASAAQLAKGSASQSALVAEGAHARDYGAKLPGISGLYGLRALKDLEAQGTRQLSDTSAQIQSRYPDVLAGIQSNRAKQQQIAFENRVAARQLGLKVATTRASIAQGNARIDQGNRRLDIQTQKTISDLYGTDAKGNLTLAGRRVAALEQRARGKQKTWTKGQLSSAQQKWLQQADEFYNGVAPKYHYDSSQGKYIPVPGTGRDFVPYQDAVRRLQAAGATLAQAQKALNAYYPRGKAGRPLVSFQAREALKLAGMPLASASAAPDERQRAFLQQHGLLGG